MIDAEVRPVASVERWEKARLAPAEHSEPLQTWRCQKCGRILAKVRLGPGSTLEIKCHSCNAFSSRSVDP